MNIKKKKQLGVLLLLVLISGIVYVTFSNQAKIRIDEDKSTFYVKPESRWLVSGREYNRLFDGTKQLYRDKSGIKIETFEDGNSTLIVRTTPYKRGPVIIDEYFFDGEIKDIEQFPVSHIIKIYNASGYFYRYTLNDLTDTGDKRKLDEELEVTFGYNMKVTLHPDYRWAWIGWPYGSDSMSVQYDIKNDYEIFQIRFFDPLPSSMEVDNTEDAWSYSNTSGDVKDVQLAVDEDWSSYVYVDGAENEDDYIYENYSNSILPLCVDVRIPTYGPSYICKNISSIKNVTVRVAVSTDYSTSSDDMVSCYNGTGWQSFIEVGDYPGVHLGDPQNVTRQIPSSCLTDSVFQQRTRISSSPSFGLGSSIRYYEGAVEQIKADYFSNFSSYLNDLNENRTYEYQTTADLGVGFGDLIEVKENIYLGNLSTEELQNNQRLFDIDGYVQAARQYSDMDYGDVKVWLYSNVSSFTFTLKGHETQYLFTYNASYMKYIPDGQEMWIDASVTFTFRVLLLAGGETGSYQTRSYLGPSKLYGYNNSISETYGANIGETYALYLAWARTHLNNGTEFVEWNHSQSNNFIFNGSGTYNLTFYENFLNSSGQLIVTEVTDVDLPREVKIDYDEDDNWDSYFPGTVFEDRIEIRRFNGTLDSFYFGEEIPGGYVDFDCFDTDGCSEIFYIPLPSEDLNFSSAGLYISSEGINYTGRLNKTNSTHYYFTVYDNGTFYDGYLTFVANGTSSDVWVDDERVFIYASSDFFEGNSSIEEVSEGREAAFDGDFNTKSTHFVSYMKVNLSTSKFANFFDEATIKFFVSFSSGDAGCAKLYTYYYDWDSGLPYTDINGYTGVSAGPTECGSDDKIVYSVSYVNDDIIRDNVAYFYFQQWSGDIDVYEIWNFTISFNDETYRINISSALNDALASYNDYDYPVNITIKLNNTVGDVPSIINFSAFKKTHYNLSVYTINNGTVDETFSDTLVGFANLKLDEDLINDYYSSIGKGVLNRTLPINVSSSGETNIRILPLNFIYSNDISLPVTKINDWIALQSGDSENLTLNISSSGHISFGFEILELFNLSLKYVHERKFDIFSYNKNNLSENDTLSITLRESLFDLYLPNSVSTWNIYPSYPTQKDLEPFGQSSTTPFWNITANNGFPIDIYVELNNSINSCIDINITDGSTSIFVNTTPQKICSSINDINDKCNLWSYVDLDCSYGDGLQSPVFFIDSICSDCVITDDAFS